MTSIKCIRTKSAIIAVFSLLVVCVAITSCSESEIAPYGGDSGIYFNNRQTDGTLSDSTALTFAYIDDETIDLPVTILVMGGSSTVDRPINLTVSGNAEEGTDYELPIPAVVKAGEYQINYVVRLIKTPALSETVKHIRLTLAANEFFSTKFSHEGDSTAAHPYVSALNYSITYSNQYLVPPVGWNEDFAGAFSVRKLDLLVKLFTDVARADYNESGKISLAKWTYMQVSANEYVAQQEQNRAMGIEYDEMAFDENGNNLYFGK